MAFASATHYSPALQHASRRAAKRTVVAADVTSAGVWVGWGAGGGGILEAHPVLDCPSCMCLPPPFPPTS
jgi:hypothetical protein